MTPLAVGASTSVIIQARSYWNSTGVQLEHGGTYALVVPSGQTWRDAWITSGPDGYDRWYLAPFFWLRRSTLEHWFALIGTIDKHDRFLIGSGTAITAPATGELVCYANDAPLFYGNNYGSIALTITRTS